MGPLVIALGVGAVVGLVANEVLYPTDTRGLNLTGFWGLFYGTFAALVVFGIALWRSRRGSTAGNVGRWLAVAVLAAFGLLVLSFAISWGVEPMTLEGAWIYPLGIVPLVAAVAIVLRS